ncbi:MAG: sulfoxide reductase heme-binding subunit YedZ [Chloroflexales bacterium]|nr:sulfoxide reductase heme-binding subunit YedZ [Chloroflexales bacterium]
MEMPRIVAHLLAAVPFALLMVDFFADNLTANPIQAIEQRTGYWAIVVLAASLACTPLNTLLGWRAALPLRRPLGLWGFFYAALHVTTFFWLDYGLDLGLIWVDTATKPFILLGLSTFLLLLPLAFTSTRGWMKRLGKRWKRLHQLIYLAAPLAVVHWIWSVKADYRQPLLVGAVIVALLALRLPAIKRALTTLRTHKAVAPAKEVKQ